MKGAIKGQWQGHKEQLLPLPSSGAAHVPRWKVGDDPHHAKVIKATTTRDAQTTAG